MKENFCRQASWHYCLAMPYVLIHCIKNHVFGFHNTELTNNISNTSLAADNNCITAYHSQGLLSIDALKGYVSQVVLPIPFNLHVKEKKEKLS